jgi:hypothetical protein
MSHDRDDGRPRAQKGFVFNRRERHKVFKDVVAADDRLVVKLRRNEPRRLGIKDVIVVHGIETKFPQTTPKIFDPEM